MSRVIVVSNRVIAPEEAARAGGVAVAINGFVGDGDCLWIGWSGKILPGECADVRIDAPDRRDTIVTLPLTEKEYRGFYLGYANSVLWPVFHNRVDLAAFEDGYFDVYSSVNRKFARAVADVLRPDDVIWVHDYHFATLALHLRAQGVQNRIGFFLHIPFPPSQAFLAIPEHRLLARALAAYDLVGVQTSTDVSHMIDYLVHGVFGQLLPDGRMRVADREFSIESFPVGIDPAAFLPSSEPKCETESGSSIRIIGVDRLDYTKGLPQKFRAFGEFLRVSKCAGNRPVLTQIAAPTRESLVAYEDIRKELESLTGAINGTYGDLDWVPIHYMNRSVSREALPAIYRKSTIGLVTPLRDGMNLVAKEYVAAQHEDNPGVLILSQFAGAAEELSEALVVNPYNIQEMAAAIETAATMPLDERKARHGHLMEKVNLSSSEAWARQFIKRLRDGPMSRSSYSAPLTAAVASLAQSQFEIENVAAPDLARRHLAAGMFPH